MPLSNEGVGVYLDGLSYLHRRKSMSMFLGCIPFLHSS